MPAHAAPTQAPSGSTEAATQEADGTVCQVGPHSQRCIECGDDFDPRFSKDGLYCFTCSVHVACSCADNSG